MRKEKIVIASILKPVNDTRMYEKMGLSLIQSGKYDVHIIGFATDEVSTNNSITFHPIFNFKRLSLRRLMAPWKVYRYLSKLQPDILMINTHELLLVGGLFAKLNKIRLLYDIRENYYRNILYTKAFPLLIRPLIAGWVRFKEYISQIVVYHYLLAEEAYAEEFSFARNKCTVIENKYQPQLHSQTANREKGGLKLLFSGTLADSTGVFHAIDLAKSLYKLDQSLQLHIIGYSPITALVNRIKTSIADLDYITLEGGNELVSHHHIISKVLESNFGIICYPYNKSTINSTPTKLYEYLANQLPILVQGHPKWKEICESNTAGIVLDFEHYSPNDIFQSMININCYQNSNIRDFLWASEAEKLSSLIES